VEALVDASSPEDPTAFIFRASLKMKRCCLPTSSHGKQTNETNTDAFRLFTNTVSFQTIGSTRVFYLRELQQILCNIYLLDYKTKPDASITYSQSTIA
jgi:hypothetical protein